MIKLAIIAGKGNLSWKLVHSAYKEFELFVVAIYGETDIEITKGISHIWVNIGEVGKAIDAIKEFKADKVVFVGAVSKPDILSLKVDTVGAKLLAKIAKDKIFGDNKLLTSLTEFLTHEGLQIIGVQEILRDLVVEPGNFTILSPNAQEKSDIDLAIQTIQLLGTLDIGQATIVENGIILGVEAAEGTDGLISRCAELKKTEASAGVLVKFSKPGQEIRADLPTIGLETIKNVHAAKFKGIAIEAKRSIFLDKEEVISYANKNKLFIIAI